ncbi:MAG TPA: LPS assembly protein LptD [Terriglobales bacterium]|nr:LPS assembly protein LptD [Terriglobales bacterium]
MTRRTRFHITAVLACHLLLAAPVFTRQSLAAAPEPPGAGQESGSSAASQEDSVILRAREQEKSGDRFELRGEVEILYQDFILRADRVTYDAATGQATAEGNVRLDGGSSTEHLEASRATYNLRTQTGVFEDVSGTVGVRLTGRSITLTTTNPFAFRGKRVEKAGPKRFIVHSGMVTSCEMPDPRWSFHTARAVIEIDETARIYNSTFRVKKVPVFYFPYAQHPVGRVQRRSGFQIPTFGTSSRKGTILGESFYWAINRSADATVGAEYWSERGWAQHGEFRARPSPTSRIYASYYGVLDRLNQDGQDVRFNAEGHFPRGFRGVADLNYLSSFVFRLAFTETFSQAVNSEVKSKTFLSKGWNGFFFNGYAARYQNFQSTTPGDVVTIWHAPSLEVSTVDKKVRGLPAYWSLDTSLGGLSRKEPAFRTGDMVGRFDIYPRASLPLRYKGWSFRPEVALRTTYYTQRQVPTGGTLMTTDEAVNRRALETLLEVRPPALARVFERPVRGAKLKHVLEPRVIFRRVSGVNAFPNIIRFDARDILSDTAEIEYAVVQRFYAKRVEPRPDCPAEPQVSVHSYDEDVFGERPPAGDEEEDCGPAEAREVVTWEVAQKYFFNEDFGGALVNGKRNVFTTSADFAGIAFLTEPRRFSPVISRLRVRRGANTDLEWHLDVDPKENRINASTALVNHRLREFFLGFSHAYLRTPGEIFVSVPGTVPTPDRFNQFRFLAGWGHSNKRGISAAANIGFDAHFDFLQYAAFQTTYNWDCCGLSMEYRRFALGSVRNENQYRFAFTLANIGSFGNLGRQERIF